MITTNTILSFDGTFEGFLSASFTAMSENLREIKWQPASEQSPLLFQSGRHIPTDRRNAMKMWKALTESGTSDRRLVYFAFLSEQTALMSPIHEYLDLLCCGNEADNPEKRFRLRAKLIPWAERVGREKRKWETNCSFRPGTEEIWRGRIRPQFDVLPLLTRYCRQKMGPRPWVLYDSRRKYGFRSRGGEIERFGHPYVPGNPRKTLQEAAA